MKLGILLTLAALTLSCSTVPQSPGTLCDGKLIEIQKVQRVKESDDHVIIRFIPVFLCYKEGDLPTVNPTPTPSESDGTVL